MRVVCKPDAMEIYLDPAMTVTNNSLITLRNTSCTVKKYMPNNEYGFVTTYKECGTTMTETASHLLYENEVTWTDKSIAGGITRSGGRKILVSCSLSRFADTNLQQFNAPVTFINSSEGI